MTRYTYTIKYKPESTNLDITNFVQSPITFTITGSSETKSAKLRLNATKGQFITQGTSKTGESTPILDFFDTIEISTTIDGITTAETYEIIRLKPMAFAGPGNILEVELLGLENELDRVLFAKQFRFASGFNVSRDIIDFYNDPDSKGSLQPVVSEHNLDFEDNGGNELPKVTATDYMFNIAEIASLDAQRKVLDKMGGSVAALGAGDFFELYFRTNPASKKDLLFEGFSSGNPPRQQVDPDNGNTTFDPTKAVTITDTESVNPAEEEGGLDAPRGTVTMTWGAIGFGSNPVNISQFSGDLQAFNLIPDHIAGEFYPFTDFAKLTGSATANDGKIYQVSNVNGTKTTPPGADWTEIPFEDFTGVSIYSPWTDGRVDEWRNSGSNPDPSVNGTETGFNKRGCYDCNLVIDDGDNNMVPVDIRSITDAYNVNYKYLNLVGGQYRGFRVLVDTSLGTPTGAFAGNDKFGNSFANNMAGYNGTEWVVKKSFVDGEYCSVIGEGKIYRLISGTWTDLSASPNENHCFHIYDSITNVQGFNNTPRTGGSFGLTSGLQVILKITNGLIESLLPGFNQQPEYYRYGVWLDIAFPFSTNTFNSVTVLGELYGNNSAKKEPVTYDTNNMHLSHSGKVGFNNDEAEEKGPNTALEFQALFAALAGVDGNGGQSAEGEFEFRCACYDTEDNVMIQDFIIPFNNLWTQVSLPLSNFQIYRARTGLALKNVGTNIQLNALEITNVFRWENLKRISIQWNESYDDQGRYDPIGKRPYNMSINATISFSGVIGGLNASLTVDAIRFAKPLLSVSPPDTSRSLQPPAFDEPLIFNKRQLDQANQGKLEIEQFPIFRYKITTNGRNDIQFGDSFFLLNRFLVNTAEKPIPSASAWVTATEYTIGDVVSESLIKYECIKNHTSSGANQPPNATFWTQTNFFLNTIKLVAKKITHNITKSPTGPGGYLITIDGSRRLES